MILRVVMNHGEIPFHYMCQSACSRGAYLRFRYVKIYQLWHISYVPNQLLKSFNFQSLILISNFETLSQDFYVGKKRSGTYMSPCIKHI